MKKRITTFVLLFLFICGYFILYHRDKELKYIPNNADAVVLVDTKQAVRQYMISFISHPSEWFNTKNKKGNTISIQQSGVKIPDFLQIFHLENTGFSDWYCILELKDKSGFLTYLMQNSFAEKGNNLFQKDHLFIKIEQDYCIAGTSNSAFENIKHQFSAFSQRTNFNSDQFIDGSLAGISLIEKGQIRNFPVRINSDNIEISNGANEDFNSVVAKLQKRHHFIDSELDNDNIQKITSIFKNNISDSVQIDYLQATADLQQVNDTIITYEYDDNFNEVEKKTIQKIVQPSYCISLKISMPEKALQYFKNKKWVNAQGQFTVIPFQPNIIGKKSAGLEIHSTKKTVRASFRLNENYIFIKNNALLFSGLKSLTSKEKRIVSDIDYIFYGNKGQQYYIQLQFKKRSLPLMLKWGND